MQHRFVEFIPNQLDEGILYISIEYCTAIHLCVCGCRNKVVTPFSPTDWKLTFDGKSISLYPSIGNWSFECKSHYWIKKSKVVWSVSWSDEKIKDGRESDNNLKEKYYSDVIIKNGSKEDKLNQSFWERFLRFILTNKMVPWQHPDKCVSGSKSYSGIFWPILRP